MAYSRQPISHVPRSLAHGACILIAAHETNFQTGVPQQVYLAIDDTRVERDEECVHSLPLIESLRRAWPMNVLSDLLTMTHGSWSVA